MDVYLPNLSIFKQRENPVVHGGRESRHSPTQSTARWQTGYSTLIYTIK